MQFGIQFFPDVGPDEKSGAEYFNDCLQIVEAAEPLGYSHIRTVEHYFHRYGGYSPNPLIFLAAASRLTKKARLITGAVIPAFTTPLKLAAEIAMVDAISGGRLDVGFARAFLPHEFRRFGISPDESVERYREGLDQVALLLENDVATSHGKFHSFENLTSLPRPTQRPRPKFYVAATITPDSFEYAGRNGHSLMAIPMAAEKLRDLLDLYRKSYREAGHPGNGEVMLAFHMFVDPDPQRARDVAREHIEGYFKTLLEASGEWAKGTSSSNYQNYDKKVEHLASQNLDKLIASGGALVGSPSEVIATLKRLDETLGGVEHASMQVNFHTIEQPEAMRSLELFAREVLPAFAKSPAVA